MALLLLLSGDTCAYPCAKKDYPHRQAEDPRGDQHETAVELIKIGIFDRKRRAIRHFQHICDAARTEHSGRITLQKDEQTTYAEQDGPIDKEGARLPLPE